MLHYRTCIGPSPIDCIRRLIVVHNHCEKRKSHSPTQPHSTKTVGHTTQTIALQNQHTKTNDMIPRPHEFVKRSNNNGGSNPEFPSGIDDVPLQKTVLSSSVPKFRVCWFMTRWPPPEATSTNDESDERELPNFHTNTTIGQHSTNDDDET